MCFAMFCLCLQTSMQLCRLESFAFWTSSVRQTWPMAN